ncbi:di-/tripeptide transporter domain protein [Neisseria gonorrhoeae]|nr:hypothetical protein [Neisseria gonorrhoeae]KAE9493432.1 di-/tripeptide transporter domain protein [Neisseria gonorrhoeae]
MVSARRRSVWHSACGVIPWDVKTCPTPRPPSAFKRTGQNCGRRRITLIAALATAIKTGLVNLDNFSGILLSTVILAVIAYFARLLTNPRVSSDNKRHIIAYIPLFLTICMFWAVWFQIYTVATVYFDETVNRTIVRLLYRRLERFYAKPVGHPVFRTHGGNVDKKWGANNPKPR